MIYGNVFLPESYNNHLYYGFAKDYRSKYRCAIKAHKRTGKQEYLDKARLARTHAERNINIALRRGEIDDDRYNDFIADLDNAVYEN